MRFFAYVMTAALLLGPRTAEAAAKKKTTTTVKKKKKKKKKRTEGWFPRFRLGFTTSLGHSHQVPGINDGLSIALGANLDAAIKYKKRGHEWQASLKIVHTQSKTPTVKPLLKTADIFDLATSYAYRFQRFKKLAVFVKLQLNAPMLFGDLVPATDTDLIITERDGTLRNELALANRRFRLTPAFSPLLFKQMLGAAITPYKKKPAELTLKLSLAGLEAWASGLTIDNDDTTPELELKALRDYQQVGLQLELELEGQLNKIVSYALSIELMYPFVTSIDTGELRGFDLLNTELSFKVSVKVAKWASLDYLFSGKRVPLIVDQWQIVNNLVVTFTANIL